MERTESNTPVKSEENEAIAFCRDVCDEELSLAEAVPLAKARMKVHPMFDVFLAKQLPSAMNHESALHGASAQRALEILDQISPGARLVATLAALMQTPDQKLRSKAALLLGRRVRNLKWTQRCLREADARVRANIIEALWGSDSAAVCEVFREAADDPEPRVAANAALGMYKARPEEGIGLMKVLERQAVSAMQYSALWARGQTDDQAFYETLRSRLRDDDPAVRGIALKGLMRLKRNSRVAQANPAAEQASALAASVA